MGVADEVAVRPDGWVTSPVVVAVQPWASVTVKLYVPAGLLNVPVPVYGAVPPLALTVTVELPPLARMGVADEAAVSADGWVMSPVVVAVQPLASVTVKLYVPVVLLNVPGPVYGAVPPLALTVTVELPPLHRIAVDLELAVSTVGWVMLIVVEAVQLLASVTVKL